MIEFFKDFSFSVFYPYTKSKIESLQFQMEDSESTKYTAKLFLNRKNFYAANSAATMRKSNSQSDNGPRSTEPQVIIEKLKKNIVFFYI